MDRNIVANNLDFKVMENRIVQILGSGAILASKLWFLLFLFHFQPISALQIVLWYLGKNMGKHYYFNF